MPGIRVQKALADAGVASRRHADELVAAGRVTVDGATAVPGLRVDPDRQRLAVDGVPVAHRAGTIHLAMHKPAGVTSTVADRHAARTVLQLVPAEIMEAAGRLYPVGRLDRDSEGLLLLTNDGDWAQRVLHPRHGIEREYAVGTPHALTGEQGQALLDGIALEEGTASLLALRPASRTETAALLDLVGADESAPGDPRWELHWYRATLAQGWKRQVRRMFAAVGAPVVRLVRVRVGTVRLGGLRPGAVRALTAGEVSSLASGIGQRRGHAPRAGHGPRGA